MLSRVPSPLLLHTFLRPFNRNLQTWILTGAIYRALVLKTTSEPLLLEVRPIPNAVPGSVVVKVLGLPVLPYLHAMSMVPGSSYIARIHATGPDAVSLTPGQLGYCDMAVRARDKPNLAILMGLPGGAAPKLLEREWRDGSYAEYGKFPNENVFHLNEELLLRQVGYEIEGL